MLLITIGLGFIFIQVNVNQMQLVPAFIGYLLIALGCAQLKGESAAFRRAGVIAVVLCVIQTLYFFTMLLAPMVYVRIMTGVYETIVLGLLLLGVLVVLQLYLLYCLTQGVIALEKTHCCDLSGVILLRLWQGIAVLSVVNSLALLFILPFYGIILVLAMAMVVVQIVYWAFFIRACYRYLQPGQR